MKLGNVTCQHLKELCNSLSNTNTFIGFPGGSDDKESKGPMHAIIKIWMDIKDHSKYKIYQCI